MATTGEPIEVTNGRQLDEVLGDAPEDAAEAHGPDHAAATGPTLDSVAPGIVRISDVAAAFGVNRTTVQRWKQQGLSAMQVGGESYTFRDELVRWLKERGRAHDEPE
jgi:MerR-like DNA binding protein